MCFVVLMGQSSSEGESSSTKSMWYFFMEDVLVVLSPARDGYSWRRMPETQRYGYIEGYMRGFEEGVVSAWAAATGDTLAKKYNQWPFDIRIRGIAYAKIVEAVNEFYSDYANREIYLSLALPIIISRISG